MAKVTITIDDTNPAIVAAFGADSLINIANDMGYKEVVAKSEDELPEKVTMQLSADEIASGVYGEGVSSYEDYPQGTVFTKQNPQTRAEYVGEQVLKNRIIPALLERYQRIKKAAALAQVDLEIDQAKNILESAASIEVIE